MAEKKAESRTAGSQSQASLDYDRLSTFDYLLPQELIAQEPLPERHASRLLVLDRKTGSIEHKSFLDILDYMSPGDVAVFNDTKVVATRLFGKKETGGAVEALLLRNLGSAKWEALVKPGRRVHVGAKLVFDKGLTAEVVDRTPDGGRILQMHPETLADAIISDIGSTPLPPYITRQARKSDAERYQTVYAKSDGSFAAPTAGLHFTPELLEEMRRKGILTEFVTLHVGIGTFRPVRSESLSNHEMHTEWFEITAKAAKNISEAPGRIIAVGTTTARALESAAIGKHKVDPYRGETNLFIKPGYNFKAVDALVTNFHLPKSTLLIMVSAFAGIDLIRGAYEEAVEKRYRFLSYGDAMFIK